MEPKHIHFIGICGVAMSALALAFKRAGHKVTGSDVGFYPPISTYLKDAGVDYYPGWHPEKMTANGNPDLVVVGNVASSTNPEWLYVQEHKLNYKSYPEVIAKFFVKENSIVVAGTYGKTTSTALMTWILEKANVNPSYMFGGLMQSDVPSASLTETNWSVLEGDEYKSSRWDNGPKFAYYSPTHLLLTSVVWDHADVYPTEESYRAAFQKLVDSVPASGVRVISEKALPTLTTASPVIRYGRTPENDYYYSDVTMTKSGISFTIHEGPTTYHIESSCLGTYMADNITGCFALAKAIGVDVETIIEAVRTFPGMKRRLEKRFEGKVTVFDDIAHSPSKAEAIVDTLRSIYTGRVIAVFEPNTGNRHPQAVPWYDKAFHNATEVVIPKLTKIKTDATEEPPLEGPDLAKIISKTQPHVQCIEEDNKLIEYLLENTSSGDVIVFMGSHGFRGMIENLVEKLSV